MKVLVTGAAGFIGARVVRRLLEHGVDVHALLRGRSSIERLADVLDRVDCHTADLADEVAMREVIARIRPDVCMHLAWYVKPANYLSDESNLACVTQTVGLAQLLAEANCRKLVGVGTCFEHAPSDRPLAEQDPLGPENLYAAAKAATHMILEAFARGRGFDLAWARLFYVYGPGEPRDRLVPSLAVALARGEPAATTAGKKWRDYLHVDDVAEALVTLATTDVNGTFNVGSGYPLGVADIAVTLAQAAGRPDLLRLETLAPRPGERPFVVADNRHIRALTGWTPRIELREGLAEALDWWRG